MNPNPEPRGEPAGENTILVRFTAEFLPHDSEEFRERARRAAERPIPDWLRGLNPGDALPPAN